MSELLDVTVHDGRAMLTRSDVCVRDGDLYRSAWDDKANRSMQHWCKMLEFGLVCCFVSLIHIGLCEW